MAREQRADMSVSPAPQAISRLCGDQVQGPEKTHEEAVSKCLPSDSARWSRPSSPNCGASLPGRAKSLSFSFSSRKDRRRVVLFLFPTLLSFNS